MYITIDFLQNFISTYNPYLKIIFIIFLIAYTKSVLFVHLNKVDDAFEMKTYRY